MSDFFPLFGPARPDSWKQTELGLNYMPAGFDHVPENAKQEKKRAKKLKKALAWMSEKNVPPYLQQEFCEYFDALPTSLPSWLDSAFSWLKQERWQPCLGKYPALGRIKPSDIRITLTDLPIWVPYWNKHTAGMMEPRKNGAITLCVATVTRGDPNKPELNWLRRVDKLSRFEMGNYGAHYVAKLDPAVREVGDEKLC